VEDPRVERCPKCNALLKERRAPRRLAGVEERYTGFRVLLNIMRFLAIIVLLIGALVFVSALGSGESSTAQSTALLVGAVVTTVVLFATAGLFELLIDVEENTRSSFRLQQLMLEELLEARPVHVTADETLIAPVQPVAPVETQKLAAAAV
jgi:hypothetical protein